MVLMPVLTVVGLLSDSLESSYLSSRIIVLPGTVWSREMHFMIICMCIWFT